MTVRVTIASNNLGTTSLSVYKKVADLFIESILETNNVFELQGDQKSTFRFQKLTFLLPLLIKRDPKCSDFLSKKGRT